MFEFNIIFTGIGIKFSSFLSMSFLKPSSNISFKTSHSSVRDKNLETSDYIIVIHVGFEFNDANAR